MQQGMSAVAGQQLAQEIVTDERRRVSLVLVGLSTKRWGVHFFLMHQGMLAMAAQNRHRRPAQRTDRNRNPWGLRRVTARVAAADKSKGGNKRSVVHA
jgi:hypothetical protein